jgi:hypothetical protein
MTGQAGIPNSKLILTFIGISTIREFSPQAGIHPNGF